MSCRSVFYFVLMCIWCYSFYFDVQYQPRIGHEYYVYKLVMLTNLNFVLFTAYSILAFMGSILSPRKRKMKRFLDTMYYTSLYPVGVITCLLFWGLYAIDPNLVMPSYLATLIPKWLNHITHSYPLLYLFFDAAMTNRMPPSWETCGTFSLISVISYYIIIFYVRSTYGYWLYPILSIFAPAHFGWSLLGAVFGYLFLTAIARWSHDSVWGKEEIQYYRRSNLKSK